MVTYKRGTTPTIPVSIPAIDITNISTIEFIFKQYNNESSPTILLKKYPTDDVIAYNSNDKLFYIYLTESESRLFIENKTFYMDTRITYTGGKIPKTNIVSLTMNNTLFAETD